MKIKTKKNQNIFVYCFSNKRIYYEYDFNINFFNISVFNDIKFIKIIRSQKINTSSN